MATLYVRIDSPDQGLEWDDDNPGTPAQTVDAVNDTDTAYIDAEPSVTTSVVNNATSVSWLATLFSSRTVVSPPYNFTVANDTTADVFVGVQLSQLIGLGGTVTITVQQLVNGNWVTVQTASGGTLIDVGGLLPGRAGFVLDDLPPGDYRAVVQYVVPPLSVLGSIQADIAFETTHLNDLEAAGTSVATGNVLEGTGADDVASDLTEISVFKNGVWVIPGAEGVTLQGQYGVLTIYADGTYSYQPNEDVDAIGEVDSFTYRIQHPNGDFDTAELDITIEEGVGTDAPITPEEGFDHSQAGTEADVAFDSGTSQTEFRAQSSSDDHEAMVLNDLVSDDDSDADASVDRLLENLDSAEDDDSPPLPPFGAKDDEPVVQTAHMASTMRDDEWHHASVPVH